ncbi:MAG: hypothetical protein J7K84_08535 [Deltaproteobacteria bacterium]|nr:hypothetical protein [Deltaproteobacteria bacterium]
MNEKIKISTKLTGKKMIIYLAVWFFICSCFFLYIHIKKNNHRKALVKIGVSIARDISSQSGLPLLEQNILVLSRIIEKITQKPEVVFASIIDHKNKIIAYTDQKQFLTLNRQKAGILDNVYFWRIPNTNHQRVMNFSSDVTFSGTKIGEVFISLSIEDMGQLKYVFIIFTILTLLGIIFIFGIVNYKDYFSWLKTLGAKLKLQKNPLLQDLENPEISCPLCGSHENFSLKVEELIWVKRLLIAQCVGIIKKVAAK